jgi:molybdopterin-guanine dinucleotide biosynthesis protein A/very-short-patch-repair endonuclease
VGVNKNKPIGLILAGGRSSRMGENKAFVKLGDKTLLEHVYQRLQPQCERVLVNTNSNDPRFNSFQTIPDSTSGQLGPLAGILAGLEHVEKQQHEWLVTVPIDCPFLPLDLVERFMSEAQCPPSPLAGEGTPRGGERGVTPSPKKQLILRQFAKNMRSNSAPAEKALWTLLRAKRFNDYKFKRQVPIGHYIADFVCFKQRLIIEADGSQHKTDPNDIIRDAYLISQNFRVRRFWNEQIFTEKNMVCDTICADLMGYTTDLITPLPPYRVPSPARGEGYNRNHQCLPSPLVGESVAKRRERGKEKDNLTSKLTLAQSNTQPHHTTGLWHISLIKPLETVLHNGIRKVQDFTKAHNPHYIKWNTTPIDPFFNINTQADLALASAFLNASSAAPI